METKTLDKIQQELKTIISSSGCIIYKDATYKNGRKVLIYGKKERGHTVSKIDQVILLLKDHITEFKEFKQEMQEHVTEFKEFKQEMQEHVIEFKEFKHKIESCPTIQKELQN